MPSYDEVIVTLFFFAMLFWEYIASHYKNNWRALDEWLIDGVSFLQLPLIKTSVVLLSYALSEALLPTLNNSLQQIPFWLGFLIVFLPDDFAHYWIHRASHQYRNLWPLHRTHHTANVYQTSIAFRENWLWFWIMPGFWWTGLMIYLGLIEAVLLSTAIIGVHNVWLHNNATWDEKLYQNRFTRILMKHLEYVLNTPGLHRGHHGLGENGVPMGNYAQTLFIWDVLFGTATFNAGRRPEHYGTTNQESMHQRWYYQLWWPVFKKSPYSTSELEIEQ